MVKIISISVGIAVLFGALYFFLIRDSNQVVLDTISKKDVDITGVKIIAFGDSLTAGYGLPLTESYPAQLEVALNLQGKAVRIINAGVSGETTKGNLERAEFIRSQNPDIVLLGIGGNDALRVLPVTDAKENITQTIETLKRGENPPVVMLLKMQSPLNAGLRYKREFDAMYEEIAQTEQIILVPFLTTEIFLNQENKLPDGIHLNKVGYGKVVDQYLLDFVSQVIAEIEG